MRSQSRLLKGKGRISEMDRCVMSGLYLSDASVQNKLLDFWAL